MDNITGEELGGLLFAIHSHPYDETAGDYDYDDIIYHEKDILKVLKAIGLPEPVWGNCIKVEDYLKNKDEKSEKNKAD